MLMGWGVTREPPGEWKDKKKRNLQPSLVGKHRWNILYEAYQELTTSGGSVDET